jgi:hypothetical protein
VEVKAIPCAHLLLHAGACTEAVAWAGRRPFDARALADCPHSDWRAWLAEKLGVNVTAAWEEWEAAAIRFLSGDGYGYGYGYGSGDGDGSGYGYGDGYGYGSSDGYGYGSSDGYSYGSSDGYDIVIREPRP